MKKPASSAYTLIELLVVLAIVTFFFTTIFASVRNIQRRAEDIRTKADIEQIKLALEVYYHENGGYPNPKNPPFAASSNGTYANDGLYCIGMSTCTLHDIPRLGFTPTGTSSIPSFFLRNLTKYYYTNKLTQGYLYTCTDPANPTARPTTDTCPPNYKVYLYHGLHSTSTIVEVLINPGTTTTAVNPPGYTDCPFPGAKAMACTGGSTPPPDNTNPPDIGPYSPGQPPPTSSLAVSCSASCTQVTPSYVNPPQFSCVWTANTALTGASPTGEPGYYSWSGDYNYQGNSPSAGTSYTGAGTKSALVNVSLPTTAGTKTGSASCSVTLVSTASTYTISIQENRNNTSTNSQPTVNSGSNYTYNAPSYSGYTVQSMVVDGVNRGAVTTWTFTNVTANHTIVVNYAAIPNLGVSCTGTQTGSKQIRWQATVSNAQGSITYQWSGLNGSSNLSSYGSSNTYYANYSAGGSKTMGVTAYDAATGQQASASCVQTALASITPFQQVQMAFSQMFRSAANAISSLISR
jgi:type II secretory pathway pseudopilin PulG